jgi:Cu+-exporting ATPase
MDLNQTMAIDPVCGMEVNMETAPFRLERDGETYYFCSRGCMLDFEDEPEKYLDPNYEPGEDAMGGASA